MSYQSNLRLFEIGVILFFIGFLILIFCLVFQYIILIPSLFFAIGSLLVYFSIELEINRKINNKE